MEKMVYTVKEVAQLLGVSLPKMYAFVNTPGFPVVKLSERKTLIPKASLEEWLMHGGFNGYK